MNKRVNRNTTNDILKGLGIMMVVWGHGKLVGTDFIYMFHMAVFIMASGYFYKRKAEDFGGLANAILHKIKALYVPYVVANVLMTCLYCLIKIKVDFPGSSIGYYDEPVSIAFFLKRIVSQVLFVHTGPWLSPTWFIRNLFFVSVLFIVIDYLVFITGNENKNLVIHGVIGILLIIIGYLGNRVLLQNSVAYNIERMMISYIVYVLGIVYCRFEKSFNKILFKYRLFIVAVGLVCLYVMSLFGRIDLILAQIVNPLFFIIGAVLGWLVMIIISEYIAQRNGFFSRLLALYGQKSMWVLILHMWVFWLIKVLGDALGLKVYPYMTFLFGITVPLLLAYIYEKIKTCACFLREK